MMVATELASHASIDITRGKHPAPVAAWSGRGRRDPERTPDGVCCAREPPRVITPFMMLYALHDALVKPMPGNAWAPSLAESQQLMHERAMFAPILEPPLLTGVGPRMAEVPTIAGHPYVSPYEDLKLR